MAGHSKWANIQHRKGAQDRKRGQVFTKLIRELSVAARLGGADPASNPRLRLAIDRARSHSMPRDTIERAIRRGAGQLEGAELVEATYEGYGPGGAAVLVACLTDNRNRTVADVRHVFAKHGGHLGADGSVAYLFNRVGVLAFPRSVDEEALTAAAIEAGAEDVVTNADGSVDVFTDPDEFEAVRDALQTAGFAPELAQVTQRSTLRVALAGDEARRMNALLEALEELDDVQHVYSNADIPEEILTAG